MKKIRDSIRFINKWSTERTIEMKKNALLLAAILIVMTMNPPVAHASEQQVEKLGQYIQKEFEKTHIPAMSVEIVNTEGIVFADSYGDGSNLDTPYILGSISKSFTAVAIMQLVEQGKIDTANPIADYLPSVNRDCETTVKQLLNQTSGIRTYTTLENYKTSDTTTEWE